MYIKLGKIVVNRRRQIDDFMIYAEVVDSGMSFEKPVFVRNINELDIWFGKNFSSRTFFTRLLNEGASLYLYRPTTDVSYLENYIDLDSLDEYKEEVIYYSIDDLPQVGIPNVKYNVNGTYYIYIDGPGWVLFSQIGNYVDNPGSMNFYLNLEIKEFANIDMLPEIGDSTKKYKVLDEGLWYLWYEDNWVSELELPQNIDNTSASLDNRDTLAITSVKYNNIPEYFHPQFNSNTVSDDPFLGKKTIQLPYDIFLNEEDDTFYYNIERIFSELPDEGEEGYRYKYNSIYYTYADNSWIVVPPSEIDDYKALYIKVNIESDSLINNLTTLALNCKYEGNNGFLDTGYLQICQLNPYSIDDGDRLLYTGYVATKNGIVDKNNNIVVSKDNYAISSLAQSIVDITNGYSASGDYNIQVVRPGKELVSWSSIPIEVRDFNAYGSLKISPDFYTTQDILSQVFLDYVDIRMWSKTIGSDDQDLSDEKNITVSIEQTEYLSYRVSISRYDFLEIFEGTLDPGPGEIRLDEKISRESKLIYCRIRQGIDELRTGEYTLRRARSEADSYNPKMYWKSFKTIFLDEIYPDYYLVPDMQKYVSGLDENYSYYTEYLTFLDVAKELSCQFLIQNSDCKYKLEEVNILPENPEENVLYKVGSIYYLNNEEVTDNYLITFATAGNDYIFNYTRDLENRLVYFFRDMRPRYLDDEVVPGYFLYLLGLTSNVYSPKVDNILYDSPVSYPYDLPYKVVYVDTLPNKQKANYIYVINKGDPADYYLNKEIITDEKLIQAVKDETTKEILSKYKSNYLVYNNNNYYYRTYENGTDYESTAWLRFAIGKVTRELQKNKGKFLGLRNLNTIRESVLGALGRVRMSFSIISNLELVFFKLMASNNKLELSVDVEVSDLVNNNIILDLVINYNNNN